jgi:hypothetical protein
VIWDEAQWRYVLQWTVVLWVGEIAEAVKVIICTEASSGGWEHAERVLGCLKRESNNKFPLWFVFYTASLFK